VPLAALTEVGPGRLTFVDAAPCPVAVSMDGGRP